LITRDATGSLWLIPTAHVLATNLNIGAVKTSGMDFGGDYTYRLATYGALNFNLNGVWTQKAEVLPIPGLGTYDCVGLHGPTCGVPTPKWRHKAYVNWTTPWNVSVRATWRHIDKVANEGT